jgi:DNA-binding transcriptional ArsR family regulator
VKEGTLHKAAVALGVYDGTIRYHIRKLGENGATDAYERACRIIALQVLKKVLTGALHRAKVQAEPTGD